MMLNAMTTAAEIIKQQAEANRRAQQRERAPVVVVDEGGEEGFVGRVYRAEEKAGGAGEFLERAEDGESKGVAGENEQERDGPEQAGLARAVRRL